MVPSRDDTILRIRAAWRALRIVAWCLAATTMARADEPGWLVRSWQTDQGLPSSCVTAIAQTTDGFLWVGTAKGLARFDGLQFKGFDSLQLPELADGRISALRVDRRGALWIASGTGSLSCYEAGRFREIRRERQTAPEGPGDFMKDDTGRALPLPDLHRTALVEDADGGMWMLSGNNHLLCCRDHAVTEYSASNGLPPGRLSGLAADDSGQAWLVADNRLYRESGGKWIRSENAVLPHDQLPPLLTPARAGGIWVAAPLGATVAGGRLIRRFDETGWHEQLEPTPSMPNSMRSEVTALLADHDRGEWLGLLWNGIWHAESGGPWQRLPDEGGLSQCIITCLFEDRRGAVWIGTDREGLHCVSRRPVTALKLPAAASENIITSSCATRDGCIWVGTDGGGAFRYQKGGFTSFGESEGLKSPHVCSILEDRQGGLWFGTWGGLFQFAEGRFERITGPPELDRAVLALFEDHKERLWAGTQGGLVFRDAGAWTAQMLLDGVSNLDIRSIAEDSAGNLWAGTIGQGLFRIHGKDVQQFRRNGGFPGQDARALYCDPAGSTLWIGTMNHGLVRYRDGLFTAFTRDDGLPCDTIGSIVRDGSGNLWIGSDNGIFSCPLKVLEDHRHGSSPKLLGTHLTLAEGLVSRACSGSGQPVPCRTNDGRLWFPNYRALAGFDPQADAVKNELPAVIIESAVMDGTDQPCGGAEMLRTSSSTRRFEFHFTVPDLVAPQSLRFRYKLEGMDPLWVDAGNQRVATYSQLPQGKYRFRVMVGGTDGRWHEAAAPLSLDVVPRLWELRWAQLLAGLLLAGAITGAIVLNERRRHRRRLARVQQDRALEQERQRIAANIHDDLGASLTRITLLSDLARERAEAGGIGPELEQIHSTSRNLTRAMDEVVWAIAPEHDTLDSLVTYLGKLAQDLLSAAGVRCRLEIPATLPELALTGQARHSLLLAAKEALHNVVKHSGAGEARVQASLQGGCFILVVSDNGHGFNTAAGNDPPATGNGRKSSGCGLRNMATRLREINGRCEVTSNPDRGTEVRFSLPLEPGRNQRTDRRNSS